MYEYLDNGVGTIPLSVLETEQQPPEPVMEGETKPANFSELWDKAKERQWVSSAMGKVSDERSIGGIDTSFEVPMDTLRQYNNEGFSDDNLKFISEATSQENLAYRLKRLRDDKESRKMLEASGWKGFAAETAAAVVDPAMLPVMLIGAPAKIAQMGRVAELGYTLMRGGAEGFASEYLLKQGDTARTDDDLYLSLAGGVAFSGLAELGKVGYNRGKAFLSRANEVEATANEVIETRVRDLAHQKADAVLTDQIPDPVARRRFLTEKERVQALRDEIGDVPVVKSKGEVTKLKDEFRAYRKAREEMIEKVKSRPKLRPTARAAEIATIQAAIDKRKLELDTSLAGNQELAKVRSMHDQLNNGKIPESLMPSYKRMLAEDGEFNATPKSGLGSDISAGRHPVIGEDGEVLEVPSQSVGAMKTRNEFDDIEAYDGLFTQTDVDEIRNALDDAAALAHSIPRNSAFENSKVSKVVRSLSSEIDTAPDDATRGLGKKLIKDPQRTIEGHQSAQEVADTLFHRATVHYQDYMDAFTNFLQVNKVNRFSAGSLNEAEVEFSRQTVMKQASGTLLSNKPVQGDDAITLGAKARSRLNELGLGFNKDNKVVGFENITHRHEYHPIVFNSSNILRLASIHGKDFIKDAIASAYQTGAIRLTRENALRLAEHQIARTFEIKGHSNKMFNSFMSDSEFNLLTKELKEQGVDKDIINDLKESLFSKEQMGEISPRAMFSLRPNIQARSGNVWFVDILDTSLDRNMKYVADGAANAGLARNGFHSKHQFQRAVSSARKEAIDDLTEDIKLLDGKSKEKAIETLQSLNDGRWSDKLDEALRLLYREPLEGHDGLKDVSRLSRKATSIIRLRTSGLMTLPEYAVAAIRNGIITSLRSIPESRFFDMRSRSIETDKFMRDFAETLSATGHQEYLFGKQFYNGADFDDMTKGSLKRIDKLLGKGLDITMTVNGFKTFQLGGEEMVARSVIRNLQKMANKGEITGNIRSSLIKAGGMSEEQADALVKHLVQHKDKDIFDAIRLLDPDLHTTLAVATRNTIHQSFLRMGIGELPAYTNKEMGKVMTSLMSFTIGSYEKMLLRGIKNEKAVLMATIGGQAVLGYMAYMANVYVQANHYDGIERDKYIEKHMSDEAMLWNTINRVGVFAVPMLPIQMLNSIGVLPDFASDAGNYSGVQSVEMVKDVARAAKGAGQLALDDNMTNRDKDKALRDAQRVLPWYNSTLWNLTFGLPEAD